MTEIEMSLNYEITHVSQQLCYLCEYNKVKYESSIGKRVCDKCVDPRELEIGNYVEVLKNDPSKFIGYIYKFMYGPCKNKEEIVEVLLDRILIRLNDKYTNEYESDSTIPKELLENDELKEIIIEEMKFYDMGILDMRDFTEDFIRTLSPEYFLKEDYDIDDLLDYIQVDNDDIKQVLHCDYHYVGNTSSLYYYIDTISEVYYSYMKNLEHFYENNLKCHVEDCFLCYKKFPGVLYGS